MQAEIPRFESGDAVRVVRNIRNDGSFQDRDKGDLLVEAGSVGIVRSYGYFCRHSSFIKFLSQQKTKWLA